MADIRLFNNGKIDLPVKEVNGDIFFDAETSAIGLGIVDASKGKDYVRWARVRKYLNSPQVAKGDWISEPDFYTLAIKANNATAQRFQYWVTHEVLPAIRKKGYYMTDAKAEDLVTNKNALAQLLIDAGEQLQQKDIQIEQLHTQLNIANKKANYLDIILSTTEAITITQIAADYGYSAVKFNKLLHEYGIQHKVHGQWLLYKAYMGKNYTKSITHTYNAYDDKPHSKTYTCWTQKGRRMIYDVLKEQGILPLIERDDVE